MRDEKNLRAETGRFTLGRPAIVCRWRIADRALPLENRHLRALARRNVGGVRVSPQLVAWAKQHIEWTLEDGASRHPDGVLMTIVDERGQAAMTVGPYEPLAPTSLEELARRADQAAREALESGVAPETLWASCDEALVVGADADSTPSGATSLALDLARTVGIPVRYDPGLVRSVLSGALRPDEAFLVSDEHGVVPADGLAGTRSLRLAKGYEKLLEGRRGK